MEETPRDITAFNNIIRWYKDLLNRSKYPKMIDIYRKKIKEYIRKKEELRKFSKF